MYPADHLVLLFYFIWTTFFSERGNTSARAGTDELDAVVKARNVVDAVRAAGRLVAVGVFRACGCAVAETAAWAVWRSLFRPPHVQCPRSELDRDGVSDNVLHGGFHWTRKLGGIHADDICRNDRP